MMKTWLETGSCSILLARTSTADPQESYGKSKVHTFSTQKSQNSVGVSLASIATTILSCGCVFQHVYFGRFRGLSNRASL